MKRNILLLALFAAIMNSAWAQGPNTSGSYYQAANGKTGLALKSAMGEIISPHTELGYDGLWKAYEKTDRRYDGTKAYVRDWYSNATKYSFSDHTGSYQGEGDMYNREHTVCQSWFEDHGLGNTIKCDVVHVVPTDGYVNGKGVTILLARSSMTPIAPKIGTRRTATASWGLARHLASAARCLSRTMRLRAT